MKADQTPADLLEAALRGGFRPQERERLAAALLPDFSEILEGAGPDGDETFPPAKRWGRVTSSRAIVDAVEYLAARARLLDRLEDALPDLGRAEWEIERKRRGAVA